MSTLSNLPDVDVPGIYALVNNETGKMYIGQSAKLGKRAYTHSRLIKNGKHSNKNLESDLKKYDCFSFTILELIDNKKDLEIREMQTIRYFLLNGQELYNCDTIESIEKNIRTRKRWEIYESLISKKKYKGVKYTYWKFVTFPESRQEKIICKLLNCQPKDIMEYIPNETHER